jgi:tubulin monoglycylase TTLL3/8
LYQIREELLRRGWFFNQERDSNYFDLKFTLAVSDIDFSALGIRQLVNHFKNSTCLTTKVGLLRTLRNCPFFANHYHDINDFFPRSYDLSNPVDVQDFLDDYHCLQAEAILKRLLRKRQSNEMIKINIGVLKTLLTVIRKCGYNVDDSFIDSTGFVEEQCFTQVESKIIQHADEWLHREVREVDLNETTCPVEPIKSLLDQKKQGTDNTAKASAKQRKSLLKILSQLHPMDEDHTDMVRMTLEKHHASASVQITINGSHSNNLWILKPAGKSRGRGISVEQTLSGITRHIITESDSRNRLNQWVIQKYIENPLTIAKRKFDIRQWVMVTGKNSMKW